MSDITFSSLMAAVRSKLLALHKSTRAVHEKYEALVKESEERGADGRPTQKALQARQKLQHPRQKSTHHNRARKAAERAYKDQQAKANQALADALTECVLADKAREELELYEPQGDETSGERRRATREEHTQLSIDRMARPFVKAMIERGVTPTALNRRRKFEYDALAELIKDAHDDPQFLDAANPWTILAKAGLLHAYRSGMTEDEARVLQAAEILREHPDDFEDLLTAANAGAIKLQVSPAFAAACLRIMKFGDAYSDGELTARMDARSILWENNSKIVGAILGANERQQEQLFELSHYLFFRETMDFSACSKWDFALFQVRMVYEAQDISEGHPQSWLPEFLSELARLGEFLANRVDSKHVLWAIIEQAGKLSTVHANFDAWAQIDRARASVQEAEERGVPYKINSFGWAVSEDEPGYEVITSPTIFPAAPSEMAGCDSDLTEPEPTLFAADEQPSSGGSEPELNFEILPPLGSARNGPANSPDTIDLKDF